MNYAEAVEVLEDATNRRGVMESEEGRMDIGEALAVLRRAEPVLEAVENCYTEDLESCVILNGQDADPDPALDIIRAALAYRSAK